MFIVQQQTPYALKAKSDTWRTIANSRVIPETLLTMSPKPASARTRPLALFGLMLFVFLSAFFQLSDAYFGYHLRTAAHILAVSWIPTTNTFSSTIPQSPWMLQQWLGTIFF